MISNTMKVRCKKDGRKYDAFLQSVDLNFNGQYVMRYNIGINGYNEWTNIDCVYNNEDFNNKYEVIK